MLRRVTEHPHLQPPKAVLRIRTGLNAASIFFVNADPNTDPDTDLGF